MDSVPMKFTGDYKYRSGIPTRNFINNYNHNNRSLVSYSSDDLALASFLAGGSYGGGGGLPFMLPQPLSRSYPPAVSVFRPLGDHLRRRHQQPPLLPFPISAPPIHQNINRNIRINKNTKNNRSRDQSLTPKKCKNQKKDPKKERGDSLPPMAAAEAAPAEKAPAINRIGSDPKDLISRDLSPPIDDFSDIISDSVMFKTSPPPSSLPLPTFSLRPKLRCNAAVAGVDAGATDNLRQLLRLR